MNSKNLESKSLIGINCEAYLDDVARLMTRKNIGALGVYAANAHDLLGLVTERDLTLALAKGLDPKQTKVSELMTRSPVVVLGPISFSEAAQLMRSRHVRHLIVNQEGSNRIVSIRDL